MYTRHFWVIGLVVLLLSSSITAVAQDGTEIPQITIEATAEGFSIPEGIPEGAVQITVANNSEALISPLFIRLNEGVTEDALMQALSEGGEEAALPLVSLLGGTEIMPEDAADVIFDFVPGTYLLINDASEDMALQSFTIVDGEGEGAAPPETDIEIELVDFAFNAPLAIPAGPQVWHITNGGEQGHHMFLVPIDDMPAGDFNGFLMQIIAGEEVEGPEPLGGWAVMSPGEQAWVTFDLEPGTYAVVCVLPDETGSDHLHAELGMRQFVIVTE